MITCRNLYIKTFPQKLTVLSVTPEIMCHCPPCLCQCSVSCGEGVQQRQVVCKSNDNSIGQCENEKPESIQVCKMAACPGEVGIVQGIPCMNTQCVI